MNKAGAIFSAIAFAAAAFTSSSASAAHLISDEPQALVIEDSAAFFGRNLGAAVNGNKTQGETFADKYLFTSSVAFSLTGALESEVQGPNRDLDITGFSLYNAGGLLVSGTSVSDGALEEFTLNSGVLAAGDYYLQVNGLVVGKAGGKYSADITLSPVPEPETYAMMLAGLGLLGFSARRRKQKAEQAA